MQRYHVSSARELARLVGVHKSPILQHFGETITGASTIRGFNKQHQFMKRNLELIDHYSRPLLHSFAAMEWLCFRLDFLTNCVFTISLLFIISLPEGAIDASMQRFGFMCKCFCLFFHVTLSDAVAFMQVLLGLL
jgi:ABC-type multidrug transport system fused ATPase/permease subunit